MTEKRVKYLIENFAEKTNPLYNITVDGYIDRCFILCNIAELLILYTKSDFFLFSLPIFIPHSLTYIIFSVL